MNPTPDNLDVEAGEDPRLLRAAQEYLAELEAGRRPPRAAFLARFADLTDALTPYLDALDLVHGAAPLLHSSGPRAPRTALADPIPVEPLGDFRIVREIGRGGMGVVYEAVQLSLGRRVALKVLPFAAALDAKQLQRFKTEAQAAAQLHHTNIVPVYAVGSERGVHYYAMQLIDGQNLADLIRQLRPQEPAQRGPATGADAGPLVLRPPAPGQALPPTGPLSPPPAPAEAPPAPSTFRGAGAGLSTQRASHSRAFYRTAAGLAVQAAEALEHAHQLGVIHRDIKPANLMVDARGNVWVTDFGLAQFHTGAGLTRTGDLLGTLRYMSPEQAGGQAVPLDPRTDVYSLGATLYELLTLQPMFDGDNHQRLLRQILNDEPRTPRAVERSVPAELETIVLKAVSKSPAERYATAQEFADDLRRFLDDKPILARRPTLTQVARKWLRRHPSVVAAGVVVLVLVSIVSSVSAGLLRAAQEKTEAAYASEQQTAGLLRAEQEKTKAAYDRERKRAEQAEERLQLAQQWVNDLIQVSEVGLADRPDLQGLRKYLLESALVYYQKFIAEGSDDPKLQAQLQVTKKRVGEIIADLAALQGEGQSHLLHNAAVLDDLRLTEAQRPKVTALLERMDKRWKKAHEDLHKLTPGERDQRSTKSARENKKDVNAVLTSQQVQRLQQIELQFKGTFAFHDPEVVAGLKLTAEQKERIRDIEGNQFGCGLGGPGPGFFGHGRDHGPEGGPGGFGHGKEHGPEEGREGPPGPGATPKDTKQFGLSPSDKMAKIVALLTDEQKRRWKEMTGEPFKGTLWPPFGQPGPGGQPGPPGAPGPGGPGASGPGGPGGPGEPPPGEE